jgi:intracellular sulfur oxidation DsrE/DsrF family protein
MYFVLNFTYMRKQFLILLLPLIFSFKFISAQVTMSDSLRHLRDSTLHVKDSSYLAMFKSDSAKLEKDFIDKAKWEKIEAKTIYPLLKGSKNSGVIPVKDPTEIPDPNIEYKILFEVTGNNPDSAAKEINYGLDEVARVINLHIASGIPLKKITPVIVVHAAALNALKCNDAYQTKYKIDNPNIKLINDLKKIGAKFIACGQAMEFFEVKKEELLPDIKISLTAQTILTAYQLKGYVWHPVW